MRSLISLCMCFFFFSMQGQIEKKITINLSLDENKALTFRSTKISRGNFQIKLVPNDSETSFQLDILNVNNPEYSVSFNEQSLKEYNYYSCVLAEGDYKIQLSSTTKTFSVVLSEMVVYLKDNTRSICGDTDDRVPSSDPKSGRKRGGGFCTVQLLSNGLLAMSGHCVTDDGTYNLPNNALVEFNVPASDPDGDWNPSLPQDQYPIIISSVQWEDYASSSCGREWTIFQVGRNAITGLTPFEAQGDFYYLTNTSPATTQNIQIVGYGTDADHPTRNLTQQIHNGPNNGVEELGNGGVIIKYETDTEGGNSGSAIQRIGNLAFSYGIHNNGGCDDGGCTSELENAGISYQYDNLENAINNYYGVNTVHVSNISNSILEDGTAFRPYDTFSEGQNASTTGSENTVVLMTGDYDVTDGYLLTKPMLIISPAGKSTVK